MDARILQFIAFSAFSAFALIVGYVAGRRGWVHEDRSRLMHWQIVVWLWPYISLSFIWPMELAWDQLWLVLISLMLILVPPAIAIGLAKLAKLDRPRTGVLAVAAGMTNMGTTLGATLCYTLQDSPEEAGQAMAVGLIMLNLMLVFGVVFMYPLAQHYGQPAEGGKPLRQLIVSSFIDLRSMSLYVVVLGLVLNLLDVPFPEVMTSKWIVLPLIYFSALLSYAGIGLRLRLSDSTAYWREHLLLVLLKFVITPALVLGVIWMIGRTVDPLPSLTREVVLIEAFMPTAIASVMIANLFHLDARMASVAWLWNTGLFLIGPLPVIFWLWS